MIGKVAASRRSVLREKENVPCDETTPKSARKSLLLINDYSDVVKTTFTEESVLHELCGLSPLSPTRQKSKKNIKISPSKCCNISSPLRRLDLQSPKPKSAAIAEILCQSNIRKSPRKRILVETSQTVDNATNKLATPTKDESVGSKLSGVAVALTSSPSKKSKSFVHCHTVPVIRRSSGEKRITEVDQSSCSTSLNASPLTFKTTVAYDDSRKTRKIALFKPNQDLILNLKRALHNSMPSNVIGREKEQKEIALFVTNHAKSKVAACMYISGAPGTGKTACLTHVLSSPKISNGFKSVITVNCMALRTAQKIYQRIATELGGTYSQTRSVRAASAFIENQLASDGSMVLLVLDEMDQLDSKHQEILYTIFAWTSLEKSKLVLIGIANSLNLTDRMLPRLQTKTHLKPKLINFKPYTREELVKILQNRIQVTQTCGASEDLIENSAVQLCARKVAATSGDARKALDICRRALEVLEIDQSSPKFASGNRSTAQKVGLLLISQVISEGSDVMNLSSGTDDKDDSFPLQQQLLVCTLILLCKNFKCKEVSLGKLHESYIKICKKRQVSSVNQSEFYSLCELAIARGIISMKKTKQMRQNQVRLNVQESDVEYALRGKALLSSILQCGL